MSFYESPWGEGPRHRYDCDAEPCTCGTDPATDLQAENERLREAALTPEEAKALLSLIVVDSEGNPDDYLESVYAKLCAQVDDNSAR